MPFFRRRTGGLGRAGLRLGRLAAGALAWAITGMAARRTDLVVRLAPLPQFLLRVRAIPLERGAEFNRRRLDFWIPGIRTGDTLSGRHAGEQKRRYCDKKCSHDPLYIDMR